MLTVLNGILSIFQNIPTYIMFAIESVWNLFATALELAFAAAVALLPSLPEVPSAPSFVGWLNWFFPVGGVVTVLTGLMTAYVTFLGIRYLFKKAGVL